MGAYGGPDIITEGLIFSIDAGSERSYPGSGTTATNLISSSTGTLTNGVGFGSGNGGHWEFDGVDDGIKFISELDLSSYSSVTYSGWVKAVGIGTHDRWFSGTSGADSFHNPDLAISTNGQLRYIFSGSGIGSWVQPSGLTIDTTKFSHLVYTFTNTGVVKIYINGTQEYTATHSNCTFPSLSNIMIGHRYDLNGEGVLGDISTVRIYNTALTAAQVLQNYNAQKNRFI